MKQPYLGKKISEIRKINGITQNELSGNCNIDIRTIQRIEAGKVYPRGSTLRLISEALKIDPAELNGNNEIASGNTDNIKTLLLITWIAGVVYFINWFFYSPLFPGNKIITSYYWIVAIVNLVTTVFFYYGFFLIGKRTGNGLLRFASIFFMAGGPVFFLTTILNINPEGYLSQLILSLLGINSVLFGSAFLKTKRGMNTLFKLTGIFQIVIAPFFIIPITSLNIIGCWMNIPLYILLIAIMFMEYKKE